MDEKHFNQLMRWLENNIDTTEPPVIFNDEWQERLEKELK